MIWGSAVGRLGAVGCKAWQQEHPCSPASHKESSYEHQTYFRTKFKRTPLSSCQQAPPPLILVSYWLHETQIASLAINLATCYPCCPMSFLHAWPVSISYDLGPLLKAT